MWHQSDPIDVDGRRFLVIEDEVAGAIGTAQCPNGGVHVYEVTPGTPFETVPVKVGYWNVDEPRAMPQTGDPEGHPIDLAFDTALSQYACTAHVFRLYPEANVMTISYDNGRQVAAHHRRRGRQPPGLHGLLQRQPWTGRARLRRR